MEHILSFSGGKDSTALLFMLIEKEYPLDRIICVDTTKEFPAMYGHIKKVQSMTHIPIEIVKIDFDYWFSEHIKTKGKNIGKKGYGWPDMGNRWCTALKRLAFQRCTYGNEDNLHKRGTGKRTSVDKYVFYHGIAFDEKDRAIKNKDGRNIKYPLVDWGITEKEALSYCYSKGLDWGGLYEDFSRVSCFCCPLSRLKELKVIYNKYSDIWYKIKEMDKKSYRKFRADYSFEQLEIKFSSENK